MGFADMDFRLVPLERASGQRGGPPAFTLIGRDSSVYLMLNKSLRKAVGIDRTYELLLNGRAIAVRAAGPKATQVRAVSDSGQSTVTTLGREVFRVRQGDRFDMPATIEDGHAWAYLPDELVQRMRGAA